MTNCYHDLLNDEIIKKMISFVLLKLAQAREAFTSDSDCLIV